MGGRTGDPRMTISDERDVSPSELWPDHTDHDIRYSEYGRTDYRLISVEEYVIEGVRMRSANNWEHAPMDGDITDTEIWCATCGVILNIEEDL